jgi:hypothetical protein
MLSLYVPKLKIQMEEKKNNFVAFVYLDKGGNSGAG